MKIVSYLLCIGLWFVCATANAQGGRITGPLKIAGSEIAHGEIRVLEKLTTQTGEVVEPDTYKITLILTPRRDAEFVLAKVAPAVAPIEENASGGALNVQNPPPPKTRLMAQVVRNTLVKGIASIDGEFSIRSFSPSESVISFTSKQFEARTTLGRSANSQTVDLLPISLKFENTDSCGPDCVEGNISVGIRNSGFTTATGKWNVALMEPYTYLGSTEDLAADSEISITTKNKIQLRCCHPLTLEVKVYPDFYNSKSKDVDETNNIRSFQVKTNP